MRRFFLRDCVTVFLRDCSTIFLRDCLSNREGLFGCFLRNCLAIVLIKFTPTEHVQRTDRVVPWLSLCALSQDWMIFLIYFCNKNDSPY